MTQNELFPALEVELKNIFIEILLLPILHN